MTFFVICFGVGFLFLIVTAALGGFADMGGHFEVGGHEIDLSGGDAGGGLGGGASFSPLSPSLISFFLTVFGGVGGVGMNLFELQFRWALLIALVAALSSATILYLVMCKIFDSTQGGVEVNVAEMAGREAEVITGIPDAGVGEIALVTAGGRLNAPARSLDGKAIPLNTSVRITRVIGNTYIVRREVQAESAPATPDTPAANQPHAKN